jgi:hypothetical protein
VKAQEMGELLAIGHTRRSLNIWAERDREATTFSFLLLILRLSLSAYIMIDYISQLSSFLKSILSGLRAEKFRKENFS